MLLRSVPFLLQEALANLRRHGLMTLAAISTIAVALVLLGGFLLTFYQVNVAAGRTADAFEMRVFCRLDTPKERVALIDKRIRALPGVGRVEFLSREAVWAEQIKNLPIDAAGVPNQMPDTFVVKVSDPRQAGPIASAIRGWHAEIDEVSVPEQEMAGVLSLSDFVRTIGLIGAALLLVAALVVVSNTIRLSVFARRREIRIMQLVGATPTFIRLPLVIEGLLHGLAGGVLAGVCLWALSESLGRLVRQSVPMLLPYFAPIDMVRCALALVACGALLGAGGAFVSIRRYLRTA